MSASDNSLHIDIPVTLAEVKVAFSVGALAFEGDLPASMFHLQLIEKFLKDIANDYGNKPKKIDAAALKYLQGLDWRGNIRELRNVVERLVIMSDDTISEADAKAFAGK